MSALWIVLIVVALLAAWAQTGSVPEDIDRDGEVAVTDLLDLLGRWGPCDG